MRTIALTLAAAFVVSSTAAHAHQIWVEQPAGEAAVIRFGEFGENLREASPGLLDHFGKPTATLVSGKGERTLEIRKTAGGFATSVQPASGESLIAEDRDFPLRRFEQGGKQIASWYWPGARYVTDTAAQQPKLTFDIVPAGQPGAFKVFFKGQPLPKAKVDVVVQSGWAREASTDEQGNVSFDLPWQGQYVVEASHIDRTPGERDGEHYDGVNYVTTLTLVQVDGASSLPAGPAAPPSPAGR